MTDFNLDEIAGRDECDGNGNVLVTQDERDWLVTQARKVAALREENADLCEAAKDCSDGDHQPFCRHYKGLKRALSAMTSERDQLLPIATAALSYMRGDGAEAIDLLADALDACWPDWRRSALRPTEGSNT